MPKQKAKKKVSKKQAKSGSLARLRRLVSSYPVLMLCVLFVVGIAVASYAYNAITDFQDNRTAQQYKKQLDQIDMQMAVEFEKIVAELGAPVDTSREKTCEYVSADLDPGNPSCGPVYHVYYNFMTLNESTKFMRDATASIGRNTQLHPKDTSYGDPNDPTYIRKSLSDTYDLSNLVRCGVEVSRSTDVNNAKVFNVSVLYRCSQVSPKPIYREVNK